MLNILNAGESPLTRDDDADEGEEGTTPPESKVPEPKSADPKTVAMAEAFKSGMSFGQIAIQFEQPSAKAVQMRLRRFAGGSPLALLRGEV